MERKFESELANDVASKKNGRRFAKKASVFALAIISSAIMIGAAAVTLSMKASAEDGAWTDYTTILSAEDYLVYDPAEDATFTDLIYSDDPIYADDFVVKRSSELKTTIFDTYGYGPTYTKVIYSVNVKLRHTSPFMDENGVVQIAGLPVSSLVINGFDKTPYPVSLSVSLNGVALPNADGIDLDTVYDDGSVSIDLVMPDLSGTEYSYTAYDMVTFFVMMKVPQVDLELSGEEIGFPSYSIVDEAVPESE